MKTDKLLKKYSPRELAEAFVFRTKLTTSQQKKADAQLKAMRGRVRKEMKPEQQLLARLLQLKYQMEDYLKNAPYDSRHSFGHFLRAYLKSLNKKNKDFASDIGIDETELSQILNMHRKPSEKIMIRLEIHSNKTIPAITWYRLLEKEREYELLNNQLIRKSESKHVKNRLKLAV